MCADSLARCVAGRMDPLALGLEHAGHRMLGQPVDLQVGMELAQLPRRSRRRVGRGPARSGRRRRARASAAVPRVQVARWLGRIARGPAACARRTRAGAGSPSPGREPGGCGREPSRLTNVPPVSSASAAPESCGRTASCSPWITSIGHLTRSVSARDGGLVGEPRRELGRHQCLGVGLERPGRRVLAVLGGVRLGEDLREEEVEEALVVLAASSGGSTSPSRCRTPAAA